MNLVNQSVKVIKQNKNDLYEIVEYAARLTHNTTDIHNCTPKEFVDKLIKSNHGTVLEFGTIYLIYTPIDSTSYYEQDTFNQILLDKYTKNKYSKCKWFGNSYYITTNLRVIYENNWWADLQYLSEETSHHVKRICVECNTSLQVAIELLRHRSHSFSMSSTRVIKYDDLNFINSISLKEEDKQVLYEQAFSLSEKYYRALRDIGATPQEAALVLPKGFMCNILMCAYEDDWDRFFDQRYYEKTGKVLPDMKELATQIFKLIK